MRAAAHLLMAIVAMVALASCQAPERESVVGEWGLSGSDVMVLGANGRFRMGSHRATSADITGTWSLTGRRLTLRVEHSECCKIPEGNELVLEVKSADDRSMRATDHATRAEIVFHRLPARTTPTPVSDKKR